MNKFLKLGIKAVALNVWEWREAYGFPKSNADEMYYHAPGCTRSMRRGSSSHP